jgi:NADH-quinone oxidoreductase subunit M
MPSFDLQAFYAMALTPAQQLPLFLAFAFAFAIKVPMWPVHTWLPDAHVEAPTAGSVILAGVLLKMGSYGFLRFAMPMFPNALAQCTPWLAWIAVIGIVYGAGGRDGAARPQEAGRVLVGEPHGLLQSSG